jgi:ribosomal protein L7/L12
MNKRDMMKYLDMVGDNEAKLQRATAWVLLGILDELTAIRKHLKVEVDSDTADSQSEWQTLARDPAQKIAAIKALREETGMDLAEAKAKVEEFAANYP